jgi:tRNA pseudouridine38-40 synthase
LRNLRLTVEYDGTSYSGWQKQPHCPTVQAALEDVLSRVSGHPVELLAAGRTDAGVHALGQVCSFRSSTPLSLRDLVRVANQLLPRDIRVVEARTVPERFHATYDASSKIYRYVLRVSGRKSVFDRHLHHALRNPRPLNLSAMRRSARCLVGTHDFRSFQGPTSYKRDPVRTLLSVRIAKRGAEVWMEFHGKSFLYNMVRILAGTLLYVGLGKIKPEDVKVILAAKDRRKAGPTLPPHGLFLARVFYPRDAGKRRKITPSEDGLE